MPLDGLHTGLRCGNGDYGRLNHTAVEFGVPYAEKLVEINRKWVPEGVMGHAGTDLFHFMEGSDQHVPAIFSDVIMDTRLLADLLVYMDRWMRGHFS